MRHLEVTAKNKGGLAMNDCATLKQVSKMLEIIGNTSNDRVQKILESGIFSDMFKHEVELNSEVRDHVRKALGLVPLVRVRTINESAIMVNLDTLPILPFESAKVYFQTGSGWVKVEKRENGLYVDDHKVILYLSERQKGKNKIEGYELCKELSEKPVLHPNILDALKEHSHLIPKELGRDERGAIREIFFWSVIFNDVGGYKHVRGMRLHEREYSGDYWEDICHRLDLKWNNICYAALLD